jgi:hypothetical protein
MTPLFRRIVSEKRSVMVPLAVAVALNVLLYGLVVYPLGRRSAGAADRAAAAAAARGAAERDFAVAQALVTGKARAEEELNAFYTKVLPPDLAAARRMTYASLPMLAERTDVQYVRRSYDVEELQRDSELGRLMIRVVLQCDYDAFRDFIYQLERAPEFVIIDDLTLVEATEGEPLTLTLNLSTYFHVKRDGA